MRTIGTRQVFDQAVAWTASPDPLVRVRGLEVLAQLGKTREHPSNSFPQESFAILEQAVPKEQAVRPLSSAISALGHSDDPRAVPLLVAFHPHPSEEVRFSVAFALGSFANEPLSVQLLLTLMEDPSGDVRDWATFGLGVLGSQDSPEIRAALLRQLEDEDADARNEALVGLAKRHDPRVVPTLLHELEQSEINYLAQEAAFMVLGCDAEQGNWSAQECAQALRERFSNPLTQNA